LPKVKLRRKRLEKDISAEGQKEEERARLPETYEFEIRSKDTEAKARQGENQAKWLRTIRSSC